MFYTKPLCMIHRTNNDNSSQVVPNFLKFLNFILIYMYILFTIYVPIGYEPADLTVHPPPPKTIEGGFIFSHRCLVSPKFFPQRKSGFCRRYSH